MHFSLRTALQSALVAAAGLLACNAAVAASIPFSVIGPHEYTLPLHFEPYFEFAQSGEANDNGERFDFGGTGRDAPGSTTLSSSAKLAYLFQIRGLPQAGFEAEAIVPAIRVTGGPDAATGLGDPVVGLVGWVKPSAHATLGLQDYFQLPLGSDSVSSHYTANIFSVLGDVELGRWNLDGDIGIVLPVTHGTALNGPSQQVGNEYFANLRGAYLLTAFLEPFLGADWQNTGGALTAATGRGVPDSSGHELAGVAGIVWILGTDSLAASYHYGLNGRNVTRTNSVLLRWIHVF